MTTRQVTLSAEEDVFIEEVLTAGEYRDVNEAIADALRLLRESRDRDGLERLRSSVRAGIHALECGDSTEIEDGELDGHLDALSADTRV